MELFCNIYLVVILLNEISKVCVSVLFIRLILHTIKWLKTAHEERNEWEPVKEEKDGN